MTGSLEAEYEDHWKAASVAQIVAAIDRALVGDDVVAAPARVFRPTSDISLRSALLGVLSGDEDSQAEADEWLDNEGVEQTFSRVTGTAVSRVVYCCVSSSMVSGCWGLFEFSLADRGYLFYEPDEGTEDEAALPILGAWEPVDDAAARRACVLAVYARQWRECVLPPAMGEWATGDPGLLRDAVLRALDAEPDAWEDVLGRLEDAPELREPSVETVKEVAAASGAAAERVRDLLPLVAARDEGLEDRLLVGGLSDEERRALVALLVHVISKDPFA